ncbi:hypothetical protein FGO68_gene992 [Halteria grandinella]|uniref:Uncharacterized protein n=1 Tax=Halteria grandinella TaxID=5974 RepID=A0A8J8SUE3_HALGN|nr:hypothetical protein FGO68_gene992 [Halteria grandinella]
MPPIGIHRFPRNRSFTPKSIPGHWSTRPRRSIWVKSRCPKAGRTWAEIASANLRSGFCWHEMAAIRPPLAGTATRWPFSPDRTIPNGSPWSG